MKEKENTEQSDDNIWKIVLALVCAGILAYGIFYSNNSIADFAYLLGFNFTPALVIWVIFYVAVGRKRGARIGGFSLLTIYICTIASGFIGYTQNKKESEIEMMSELKNEISEIFEVSTATDSLGVPTLIKPINATPKFKGELGEIEKFLKQYINQMLSLRNDYFLDLEAVGWNSILDFNRIKSDETFVESNRIIINTKNIINKYINQSLTFAHSIRDSIKSLNISESTRNSMLSGFNRTVEKGIEDMDKMWSLEKKVVTEFENIITLLTASKGSWIIVDEQVLFYNDSDLEMFNSYIASIEKIVNQQEEIQQKSAKSMDRIFGQVK